MSSRIGKWSSGLTGLSVKARRQFFRMSMREKSLLLLFAIAVAGVWFSLQVARHQSVQSEIALAHSVAGTQREFLAYSPRITDNYESLISEVDLERLPSKDEVSGEIDALARSYAFNQFSLGQPKTTVGSSLSFHEFPLTIQQVTYPQIKQFTEELKEQLPYVSLERIIIRVQSRDDRYLDVNYILKSIEYTQ